MPWISLETKAFAVAISGFVTCLLIYEFLWAT